MNESRLIELLRQATKKVDEQSSYDTPEDWWNRWRDWRKEANEVLDEAEKPLIFYSNCNQHVGTPQTFTVNTTHSIIVVCPVCERNKNEGRS